MNFRATHITALLTGVWTAFGFSTMEAVISRYEVSTLVQNSIYLVIAIIFFISPLFIFVIGKENLRLGFRYSFSKEYFSTLPYIAGRILFWFVGAAVFGVIYNYLLYGVL